MKLLRVDISSETWRSFRGAVHVRLRQVRCRGGLSISRVVLKQQGYAIEPSVSQLIDAGASCDCVAVFGLAGGTHQEFSKRTGRAK